MKSFKDYARQTPQEQPRLQTDNRADAQQQNTASAEELTKKIAAAYNGKSNADMLRGILSEAEKSKRAGTLSNEEIDRFYQSFAPMLDSSQRKRLKSIVERLKKI